MKKGALVLSSALLLVAFVWSCQQQESAPLSPVSPEGSIAAKKGGGAGGGEKKPKATFDVQVYFDDELVATRLGAVASRGETHLPGQGGDPITLTLSKGVGCYPAGTYVGELAVPAFDPNMRTVFYSGHSQINMDALTPDVWLPLDTGSVSGETLETILITGKGKNRVECSETGVPQVWRVTVTRN